MSTGVDTRTGRTAWLFPGQGSQRQGMGLELLSRHPEEVRQAEEILGWSVSRMCAEDPDGALRRTEIAQPAIFIVDVLAALEHADTHGPPDVLAGHSLGEYAALHVAGCFDFATGVRLVRRRGELMSHAPEGAMAAVVGVPVELLQAVLTEHAPDVEIANHNSPDQLVLSGPTDSVSAAVDLITERDLGRAMWLPVSGAFHSRLMRQAASDFVRELRDVEFADPKIPVIANVTGLPYPVGRIRETLAQQIDSPVRWAQSMAYLAGLGVTDAVELGPGTVLTSLWRAARRAIEAGTLHPVQPVERADHGQPFEPAERSRAEVRAEQLGSADFRADYGIRYAYLAGSMYHGIASTDLVIAMAQAGLFGFFGSGGLRVDEVDAALGRLEAELGPDGRYGVNLLCTLDNPELEAELVDLYLHRGVRFVEAAAYSQMTPPLVRYRFTGARIDPRLGPVAPNHVLAKVSRTEVAEAFLSPAPDRLIDKLVRSGALSEEEGRVARCLPVSQDVCVECDSAGHTDRGNPLTLFPAMRSLRAELVARHSYRVPIRLGAAGGLGSPEALAVAFLLGADFVVTGSINQCTVQASTSDAVKDMLAALDVSDTTYAPAGDMFELGAQVQVARKGTLFPARAAKLYQVYRQHRSWSEVDPQARAAIERDCLGRSFEDAWADTRAYLAARHPDALAHAERDERRRMAVVFRDYFRRSTELAMAGAVDARVDYQIHCGPAMGSFNRWVAGTELANWRARDVGDIADRLMRATAELLGERICAFGLGS